MNTVQKTELILEKLNWGVVEYVQYHHYELVDLTSYKKLKYLPDYCYGYKFDLYDPEHVDLAWLALQRLQPNVTFLSEATIKAAQCKWLDAIVAGLE